MRGVKKATADFFFFGQNTQYTWMTKSKIIFFKGISSFFYSVATITGDIYDNIMIFVFIFLPQNTGGLNYWNKYFPLFDQL